jgi:DcmR-like sensory protein
MSGLIGPVLADVLAPVVEKGACPHVAALLKSPDELPSVLASFYALGARRDGWLVHRSIAGEADADRRALGEAGLDAAGLEASGQLVIAEFDPNEPPERSTDPWEQGLEEALRAGRSGLWYSRFAVGPDAEQFAAVLPFERAWERAFHGRPVVTLCPYLVGALAAGPALERFITLADIHDGVLVPAGEGFALARV